MTPQAACTFIVWTLIIAAMSVVATNYLRVPLGDGFYINITSSNRASPYIGDAVLWLKRPTEQAYVAVFNASGNGCSIIGGLFGIVEVCDRNNQYKIVFPSVTADYGGLYYPVALELPQLKITPLNVIVLVPVTSVAVSPTTSLSVVTGRQVTLTCNVNSDAALPITFTWQCYQAYILLGLPSNSVNTTLPNGISNTLQWTATKQDNGGYCVCKASNEVSSLDSSSVTILVYYPANNVTLTASATTVAQGTAVSIKCESQGGNPLPGLVLYREPGHQQVLAVNPPGPLNYVITLQSYDNGANFTCETKAEFAGLIVPATVSNVITMNVEFAPTWIDTYGTVTTPMLEHQSRDLYCRAGDSNPAGTITWYKTLAGTTFVVPSLVPSTKSYGSNGFGYIAMNFVNITTFRSDNGAQYWCEADYTYLNSTDVNIKSGLLTLVVFYPVDVEITISPSGDIVEGDHVILTCATSGGNPTNNLMYTWSYNNNVLSQAKGSTLEYITIGRGQSGQYRCTVVNAGGSATVNKTIDVKYRIDAEIVISPSGDVVDGDHVTLTCNVPDRTTTDILTYTYKPRIDESRPHRQDIGATLTENVTFTLNILANPLPTSVIWTKDNTNLGSRFKATNDSLTYKLRVDQVLVEDYGNYSCRLVNAIGESEFTFTLNPRKISFFLAGPPNTPSNFMAISSTYVSLTVSWRSEFSGATSQNFSLLYAPLDGSWSQKLFDITDPGNGKTICRKITNLRPSTSYRIRVQSQNSLGLLSMYTPIITAATNGWVNGADTTCSSKVPPAIALCDTPNTMDVLSYIWTYENCVLNQVTGNTFVLNSIHQNQSGEYKCTVGLAGLVAADSKTVYVKGLLTVPLVAIAGALAALLLVIMIVALIFVLTMRGIICTR